MALNGRTGDEYLTGFDSDSTRTNLGKGFSTAADPVEHRFRNGGLRKLSGIRRRGYYTGAATDSKEKRPVISVYSPFRDKYGR